MSTGIKGFAAAAPLGSSLKHLQGGKEKGTGGAGEWILFPWWCVGCQDIPDPAQELQNLLSLGQTSLLMWVFVLRAGKVQVDVKGLQG